MRRQLPVSQQCELCGRVCGLQAEQDPAIELANQGSRQLALSNLQGDELLCRPNLRPSFQAERAKGPHHNRCKAHRLPCSGDGALFCPLGVLPTHILSFALLFQVLLQHFVYPPLLVLRQRRKRPPGQSRWNPHCGDRYSILPKIAAGMLHCFASLWASSPLRLSHLVFTLVM